MKKMYWFEFSEKFKLEFRLEKYVILVLKN